MGMVVVVVMPMAVPLIAGVVPVVVVLARWVVLRMRMLIMDSARQVPPVAVRSRHLRFL
jgi:hypothetical protein